MPLPKLRLKASLKLFDQIKSTDKLGVETDGQYTRPVRSAYTILMFCLVKFELATKLIIPRAESITYQELLFLFYFCLKIFQSIRSSRVSKNLNFQTIGSQEFPFIKSVEEKNYTELFKNH